MFLTRVSTASVERASSLSRARLFNPSSFFSSTSVATTVAPSLMKASAMARPIPCPAAVTSASLLCRRPGMPVPPSVVVAWNAVLSHALIFYGWFEHHSLRELIHHSALDFLPGCLARRIALGACRQASTPLRELGICDQDVCRAFIEIDADAVSGLQESKASTHCRFGRCIHYGRRCRCSGLPSIPNAGERGDTFFDQRRRRLHVHHLRRSGIADGPHATDEQHGALVDLQGRILDAGVIILGPLEHDGTPLERVRIGGVREIALSEFLRDHAGLHDRRVE